MDIIQIVLTEESVVYILGVTLIMLVGMWCLIAELAAIQKHLKRMVWIMEDKYIEEEDDQEVDVSKEC